MIFEFLIAVLCVFGLLGAVWLHKRSSYWKRQGIPHVPSSPLFGHFDRTLMLQESIKDALNRIYYHRKAKRQPFVGINIFYKPAILIRDPELVKQILIKDFNHFSDRHTGADPTADPIGGNNLFQMKNPSWRKLRNRLSSLFTSGKMKQMFYMIEKVSEDLKDRILKEDGNSFDARKLFSSFTVDVIALAAFGTEANCLKDPESSEFLSNAKKSLMSSRWSKICFNSVFFLPEIFKYFGMTTFDPDFGDFLRKLFNEVTAARIASKHVRNDLIDALIAVQKEDSDGSIFSEDVLVAQAAVFFVAGFETSSSTLAFIFYQLAENTEIQSKLRDEITSLVSKNNQTLSYENVMNEMPFLSAIINESLRLYPPLPFLDRECVVHEYSLEPFSSFKVPYKMPIIIPVSSIQTDPEYFQHPTRFDPERFIDVNSSNYTFMPFGLGPHNCIGERFAWMQVKMAIITAVRSFEVRFADNPRPDLELDETCILFRPKYPVNIKFVPIKNE